MKRLKAKLLDSPINFFSDLFIVAMVVMWIADNIYEALIATFVTVGSLVLSFQTGYSCIDTSMWSSIGSNVAIPLTAGGALWMVKNGVQHAIFNHKGKEAPLDFPNVGVSIDIPEQKEVNYNDYNRLETEAQFSETVDRLDSDCRGCSDLCDG